MRALTLLLFVVSSSVLADEVTYQFRSMEDPAFPPDDSICAQAPFVVNVKLGASLWSQDTRSSDGKVVNDQVRRIGRATACVRLTNFLFPAGLAQEFYAVFDLPSGRYTAVGTCMLSSNNVPAAGLVLAGCTLNMVGAPDHVLGGLITSASTFNPFRLPGFNTGSVWTVQAYDDGTRTNNRPGAGHDGFQWHDDRRSPEQLDHARNRGGRRDNH